MSTHHFSLLSLLFILCFTACLKEECFDSNSRKENYFIKNIPTNFDWSMSQNVSVTVTPDDNENSHYYTAEIYSAHPTLGTSPILYAKGVCSGNKPFTQSISIPAASQVLYIQLTTPINEKIVAMVDVEQNIDCNFAPGEADPELTSRGIATQSAVNNVSFTIPNNAIEINENNHEIKKGNTYIINGTYTGEIKLPGEGNFSLYIKGTWNCPNNTIRFEGGSKVYVLNGGTLNFTNTCTTNFINQSYLYIEKGGKVIGSNMKMTFTNSNSSIINYGDVDIQFLEYQSGAYLYNYGNYSTKQFIVDHNTTKFTNKGNFSADYFQYMGCTVVNDSNMYITKFKGEQGSFTNNVILICESADIQRTTVYNNCYISNKNDLNLIQVIYEGAKFSEIETNNCHISGSHINLRTLAQFVVDETCTIEGETSHLTGKDNKYSLLSANKIIMIGWECAKFKNNLEIECRDYTQNAEYFFFYRTESTVHFVSETTLEIPECTCNHGRNKEPQTPVDPKFPYEQESNINYTWVSEDNYPSLGDYDMNDMVMRIKTQTLTKNEQNLVEKMKLNMTMIALGATKRVGAAVQLDKLSIGEIASAQIKGVRFDGDMFVTNNAGLETEQTYPVVPLFDNAHKLLGYSVFEIINTIDHKKGNLANPLDLEMEITFTTPVEAEKLNINNLNFFIISGNTFTPTRSEVHIPGFAATDKSSTPDLIEDSASGLMWGLMIPMNFIYPTESINILKAYPDFENWVVSNKTQNANWYNNPSKTDGYVYIW